MEYDHALFGREPDAIYGYCTSCGEMRDRDGKRCRKCVRRTYLKAALAMLLVAETGAALAFWLIPRARHHTYLPADTSHYVPPPADGATGWTYYDTTDTLVSDVTHHARLLGNSAPTVKGTPAMKGAVAGTLALAASPHYGKSVIVTFPAMHTKCVAASPCGVKAIFDQSEPVALQLIDVFSERQTTIILGDYDLITARLRVSHDLTLIATLGGKDDVVLNFTVQGYRTTASRQVPVRLASSAQARQED